MIVPLYGTLFILMLPVYFICFLLDLFLKLSLITLLPSFSAFFYELMVYLPIFTILAVRYVFSTTLDIVFFSPLTKINSDLSKRLKTIPYLSFNTRVKKFTHRTVKKLLIALAVMILSFVPILGPFVIPVAQFYATYQMLGLPVSILYLLVSLLPFIRAYSVLILGTFYAADSLFRELLDPYLSRTVYYPKTLKFKRGREVVFFGFSVPATICLAIPIVGPLLFPLFQAAAANILNAEYDQEAVAGYTPPPRPVPITSSTTTNNQSSGSQSTKSTEREKSI